MVRYFLSSVKILWLFSVTQGGVPGGFSDTTYDMKYVFYFYQYINFSIL